MYCVYLHSVLQAVGAEDEELDAGEAFERMQINRVAAIDPTMVAYHAALKKTGLQGRPQGTFGGVKAAADATRKKEHEAAIAAGLTR